MTDNREQGMLPLEPAVRKVWRVKLAIAGGLFLFFAIVYDVSNLFDPERSIPPGVFPVGVVLVFTFLAMWLPGLRYRFWRYRLTDDELLLERGVLNRVRTIVPLRRVQHLDVSQDIIEREFELGKLVVHTAGTRSSEVILPGLRMEEAERLRDRIKTYILDDVV